MTANFKWEIFFISVQCFYSSYGVIYIWKKPSRFWITLFRLSLDDLLNIISEGLKNSITIEDLYAEEIKASTLKKLIKYSIKA